MQGEGELRRLKGLPGATGNSTRERKPRKPEAKACLTLQEFERWLALEVGQRYHQCEHRGLFRSTPHAAWQALCEQRSPRQLAPGPDEALKLLIHFMPLANRSVQRDGLTLFYIRYWHPIFVVWREKGRRVRVRYHPEDLSRIFLSADGRNYVEARSADLRRPRITLWEQRAAVRSLRANHDSRLSEELVFGAIGQQRKIVDKARRDALRVRRGGAAPSKASSTPRPQGPEALGARPPSPDHSPDYDKPASPYPAEVWK